MVHVPRGTLLAGVLTARIQIVMTDRHPGEPARRLDRDQPPARLHPLSKTAELSRSALAPSVKMLIVSPGWTVDGYSTKWQRVVKAPVGVLTARRPQENRSKRTTSARGRRAVPRADFGRDPSSVG
jgi:hypothetical protein